MIEIGHENDLDHMQMLVDGISTLEKRMHSSVRDHLRFGKDSEVELKYFKNKYGQDCIGEVNGKNQLHGKGI